MRVGSAGGELRPIPYYMLYTCCMDSLHPIHSAPHRGSPLRLLSPAFAGVLVAIGVLGSNPVTLIAGVGLALFVWFTRHARYEIFHDRLVIHYGRPRQKTVPLAEIQEVQLMNFPLGGLGLFVRTKRGWGMTIKPTDPERFAAQLEEVRRGLAG